ncbi:hypothetical protein IWQ60_008078 [Tieghemiomyces parasiticus]|uniref:DUF2428 domain-containing protein n=1 Tax=Tieghemiomyces parasiticus TaxID=78921 RepID=A0A9W7ZU68_9FUNG|nr:hypothetical protein IWQ60_008078 [Tieghemiomyces parasiticus]
MGLLAKTRRRRDQIGKPGVTNATLAAHWAPLLKPFTTSSPSTEPILGPLYRIATDVAADWTQQGRWFKQLEKALKTPGADIDPELVSTALLDVASTTYFAAPDLGSRRQSAVVLTAAVAWLAEHNQAQTSSAFLHRALERFARRAGNGPLDCFYRRQSVGQRADTIQMLGDFPVWADAIVYAYEPLIITLAEGALETALVLAYDSEEGSPDLVAQLASLHLSPPCGRADRLEHLKRTNRAFQMLLTTADPALTGRPLSKDSQAPPATDHQSWVASLTHLRQIEGIDVADHTLRTRADLVAAVARLFVDNVAVFTLEVAQIAGMVLALVHEHAAESAAAQTARQLIELPVPADRPVSRTMGILCLVRGFLVYLPLADLIRCPSPDQPALILALFDFLCAVANACHDFQDRVLIFESLALWIGRIRECLSQKAPHLVAEDVAAVRAYATRPALTETVLKYVWDHWDDPVDAIQHKVRAMFDGMLELSRLEGDESPASFTRRLLDRVLALRWEQKVKYPLLASVARRLGPTALFTAEPGVLTLSLTGVHDTILRTRVTELHGALLQGLTPVLRADVDGTARANWRSVWCRAYGDALLGPQPLTRKNVSGLLLPTLLRTFPEAVPELLGYIRENPQAEGRLPALLAVAQASRALDLLPIDEPNFPCSPVDVPGLTAAEAAAALRHPDETVRLDLLGVLTEARRGTQPVTPAELAWIGTLLQAGMADPSPDFRQRLDGQLHRFMARLRGNCYQWERERRRTSPNTPVPDVELNDALPHGTLALLVPTSPTLAGFTDWYTHEHSDARLRDPPVVLRIALVRGFLTWLINLCLAGLYPSAPFPRVSSALRLLDLLATHFGVTTAPLPDGYVADGQRPPPVFPFRLPLASPNVAAALLQTLDTAYDDTRRAAFTLLRRHFRAPLPAYGTPTELRNLVATSRRMLLDQRAHEAEAGALRLRLLYGTYTLDTHAAATAGKLLDPSARMWVDALDTEWTLNGLALPATPVGCLTRFVVQLELCAAATGDLTCAARDYPAHGPCLAVRYALEETPFADRAAVWRDDRDGWQTVVNRILAATTQIVEAVLPTLTDPSPEGLPVPITAANGGIPNSGDDTTNAHQAVLSYCWRAMKEAGALIRVLLCALPGPEVDGPLDHATLTTQASRLRDWLLTIRHSGAFSALHPEFAAVCTRLLASPHSDLAALPARWLDDALGSVTAYSVSVTRRSAGLPLAILAIVSGEPAANRRLLGRAAERLVTVAAGETDGTHAVVTRPGTDTDLPQVHALNVLRKLFTDAAVAAAMLPYVERGFELAVMGFTSPSWAVRNCSVMLFSALVTKTFGTKSARVLGDAATLDAADPPSVSADRSAVYAELPLPEEMMAEPSDHRPGHLTAAGQSLTGREFFGRFPRLYPFLLARLADAVNSGDSDEDDTLARRAVHPGLFPILLLLGKLHAAPVAELPGSTVHPLAAFLPAVEAAGASPDWRVRTMAAQATVGLVPGTELVCYLAGRCSALVAPLPPNAHHGRLLQVAALLRAPGLAAALNHPPTALEFVGNVPAPLLAAMRGLTASNLPGAVEETLWTLIRSYLACLNEVLRRNHGARGDDQTDDAEMAYVTEELARRARAAVLTFAAELVNATFAEPSTATETGQGGLSVGAYVRPQALAPLGLRLAVLHLVKSGVAPTLLALPTLLRLCLHHPAYEARWAALQFVTEGLAPESALRPHLAAHLDVALLSADLVAMLLDTSRIPYGLRVAAAALLARLESVYGTVELGGADWAGLLQGWRTERDPALLGHLLPLLGTRVAQAWPVGGLASDPAGTTWRDVVWHLSHPDRALPLRLAAATALAPAVSHLFSSDAPAATVDSAFVALTRLLADDDPDVREVAAQSVAQINGTSSTAPLHPDWALRWALTRYAEVQSDRASAWGICLYLLNPAFANITPRLSPDAAGTPTDLLALTRTELAAGPERLRTVIRTAAAAAASNGERALFAAERRNLYQEESVLIATVRQAWSPRLRSCGALPAEVPAIIDDVVDHLWRTFKVFVDEVETLKVSQSNKGLLSNWRGRRTLLSHTVLTFNDLHPSRVPVCTVFSRIATLTR